MSTLSQRLARLDAVARRKAMDERNAKRRAEYAVRPKVLLWDDPAYNPDLGFGRKKTEDAMIEPDFDDLCNWYNSDELPSPGAQGDE